MKFSHVKNIIIFILLILILTSCDKNKKNNIISTEEISVIDETEVKIEDMTKDDIKEDIPYSDHIYEEDIYIDKEEGGKNTMVVAFFSASGNTKTVSKKIIEYYHKKGIVVDLYEIEPALPYSEKDLDYMDKESRCCKEHYGDLRPELKDYDFNIDKHEDIFIGYPVWWGEAPNVVYTFLEKYDFKNKNIYPFVTSHTSPLGESTNILKNHTEASVHEGKRFVLADDNNEVDSWLDSLQLEK